jgi:hypothetical protein
MPTDIIGLARNVISPDAIGKLSRTLGESPTAVQRALEAGVPAILAGLAWQANHGAGRAMLSIFNSGDVDRSMLQNFNALLASAGAAGLMTLGQRMVEKVLGDKAQAVADAISSHSGVRPSSAVSLLELSAPLAFGAISYAAGSGGITLSSLMKTLESEREAVARLLPAGLGGILGGAALAEPAFEPEVAPNPKGLRRFWPFWALLAVLVVVGLIWSLRQDAGPM